MKTFIQCLQSLGTGMIVGAIFAFVKLPAPSPNAIAGVMGILGITLGYLLIKKIIGD